MPLLTGRYRVVFFCRTMSSRLPYTLLVEVNRSGGGWSASRTASSTLIGARPPDRPGPSYSQPPGGQLIACSVGAIGGDLVAQPLRQFAQPPLKADGRRIPQHRSRQRDISKAMADVSDAAAAGDLGLDVLL